MEITFTIDEAWQIYERVKGDFFYFKKIYEMIPEDGKAVVKQQINDLKPVASKLEAAFPKFSQDAAQDELERRAEERMKQEGFR